jgi:hypothetical protein
MTIHALATGPLWKAPEQRTAKNGNPFVTATIKVRGGDAAQWVKLLAFSETAQNELKRLCDGDAGLNHCLRAAAHRRRRQFREDCHGFALKRRTPGKVAGQRCDEGFRPFEGGTCTSHSRRLPRPLLAPVPSRS